MQGKFIVLEGCDALGKTTQVSLIEIWLKSQGVPVKTTKEPSGTPLGLVIRQALKNPNYDPHALALLFAADRLEHLRTEIVPALERGEVVLCDRFIWSSLVYQTEICGLDPVVAYNWKALQECAKPDLVLYFQSQSEIARTRLSNRPELDLFEAASFQKKIAQRYQDLLFLENPFMYKVPVQVVDADKNLGSVTVQVQSILGPFLLGKVP